MGILVTDREGSGSEHDARKAKALAAKAGLEDAVGRAAGRLRSDAKTRKSAATREKIMAAATELMVEHNGTDFQMSEVSSRCNMSKGSLYYYFADKGALVQAIFDREVDDLVDRIESVVADAPSSVASIDGLARVLAESLRPRSPLALAVTRELVNSKHSVLPAVETRLARIINIFEAQIDRAKAEGLARPEVSSRLCAISITGAFIFAIFENPEEAALEESESFAHEIVTLMMRGMGTERAFELYGRAAAGE